MDRLRGYETAIQMFTQFGRNTNVSETITKKTREIKTNMQYAMGCALTRRVEGGERERVCESLCDDFLGRHARQ